MNIWETTHTNRRLIIVITLAFLSPSPWRCYSHCGYQHFCPPLKGTRKIRHDFPVTLIFYLKYFMLLVIFLPVFGDAPSLLTFKRWFALIQVTVVLFYTLPNGFFSFSLLRKLPKNA